MYGPPRCRGFPAPDRCRSTVGACCENDAGSESAPPPRQNESVPATESTVAWPWWHVCDSPPAVRGTLVGASAAAGPVADRVARRGGAFRPRDLVQPLSAMSSVVDIPAGTGDRPAMIQSFQSIHHTGQIFDHGQITTRQCPRHAHPFSPWYTGLRSWSRRRSASLRASILSLLLPCLCVCAVESCADCRPESRSHAA